LSLLVISLVALVVGPLLYRVADPVRTLLAGLDGFVVTSVGGLVLVHIIPHGVAAAGPLALVLALVGFFGPGLIESTLHTAARQAHAATLLLAVGGLTVHAFFDGVALAAPEAGAHGGVSVLATAVVVHRLPIAITIWWLLRPSSGRGIAVGTLTGLGVATIAGYTLGDSVGGHMDARWLGLFQALVAGSLLHVVVHRPSMLPARTKLERFTAGIGALAGIGMVAALADTHLPLQHESGVLDFGQTFVALALETAPALVFALALAGMIQVLLPAVSMRWMRTGRPLTEAVRGVAFGLPLPICSCGVVPLYRTLALQGVPATAAMAFLVATPELGLDAVLISLPLLGAELAVTRIICATVVAIAIGWWIGRIASARRARLPIAHVPPPVVRGRWLVRISAGLRFGFSETVDHIGPWLIVGMVIASLVEPMLRGEWIAAIPWGLDVVLFAALGMPSYVCASGATPLAAVLIHKGVSPGAAIAFLLAGPATNVTTFGVLGDLHGRRIATMFGAAIAGLAVVLGLVVNVLLGDSHGISLHEAVHEGPGVLATICLCALAIMSVASVLRQGPRDFLYQVLSPYRRDDDHGHGHGNGHG